MLRKNTTGSIKNPVTTKKTGINKESPKNSNFSLAGFSRAAALTANPARKAPTMPGRLMICASTAATPMIPSITTKYPFSSDSTFFSRYAPQPAQPDQDERNEGGDLDDLNSESRNGEPTVVGGSTDCEDDQGQRVRHDRRAHSNHDWLKPGCPKSENDRQRQKGMRRKQGT